jgi:bifunctional non-homologous end joining protein LigD
MEQVEGVLATPDGYWRVEAVRDGRFQWYRIRHANTVIADKASIATVERILGPAFATLEQSDAA